MTISEYINIVNQRYKSGISREHSYRGDLENLLRSLCPDVNITNEPANVTDCGNPDYVITGKKIPIGYIEAKDIGKDLNSKQYKEQFTRYRKALDNLIITDYLHFQFFQNNELVHEIRIGEIDNNSIKPISEKFDEFENLIKNFCTFIGQTIKSSKKLAVMMAAKARLLENILEKALSSDEVSQENTSLKGQFETFKQLLIHDLTPKGFADLYAQTLAYGMFAARLHDKTLEDFSRQEAAELIPKTNPFLRKLFGYVAGPDIDDRIRTTVDNLADVFRATDVDGLLHNFGKSTQTQDPIIHFYETFLAEYDPKLRKSRGVWYTPEPVVKFIVRAVDDILKTEFGLPQGLADTSKTKIKVDTDFALPKGGYRQVEKEVHKVQILDPATGTGTFLAEVIKFIYDKKFKSMQGTWSKYVDDHLIPRLNGFELLMASYSMAHLKLDMLLQETGYKSTKNQRFNVYLTNSLEEHHPDTGTLFSSWLSSEANEANHIKRNTPVMCVIGNPPYSISSSNKSDWINNLMKDYKRDLNERNIQPLSDDYIKFIRYGEYLINKNGEGILAFISNNSFIDGIIHRQMRKHLLETFDKIYILDLHGNSKKKETCPDGSKDENIFDIMQGVSVNIFVKNKNVKKNEKLFFQEIYGSRSRKYDILQKSSIKEINFKTAKKVLPYYFFTNKNFMNQNSYLKGFKINGLFSVNNTGIETGRDKFFIDIDKNILSSKVKFVYDNLELKSVRDEYKLKNNSNFKFLEKLQKSSFNNRKIKKILYRPFDFRFTYYDNEIQRRSSYVVSRQMFNKNLGLLTCRQQSTYDFQHVFVSKIISERCTISLQTKETGYLFPLYLYTETIQNDEIITKKIPNLNKEIIDQISKKINLSFRPEKEETENTFAPIDILDYIYAVLHSPSYREKYKEFLKIDFPRIPYPKDKDTFWKLVDLGGQIRQIHLLESPKVTEFITTFPIDGTCEVTRKMTTRSIGYEPTDDTTGKVWINDEQYFDQVPLVAWEFYIGGYQPAQKWLKDRHGRELSFDDIEHYQKIIVALTETDRLMKEIDTIEIE